ncbi:MAG: biotin/lipoate A/B protein ligase family protein [Bryobacteraceae bacterium]
MMSLTDFARLRVLGMTACDAREGLAVDERLFEELECDPARPGYLRVWESHAPAVVLGRSGRREQEVDSAACERLGVPVLRRSSGGGTVVVGPGCLNYSLILSLESYTAFRDVRTSFCEILRWVVGALAVEGLAVRGQSDLAIADRKVSGSAQRRGRRVLLHHGTLLYGFDAELAERLLPMPPRRPEYRRDRSHREFLGNLPLGREEIVRRLTLGVTVGKAAPEELAAKQGYLRGCTIRS